MKRNWVRRLRWERATVCMVPVRMEASLVESGRRTYFRERSYLFICQ